MPEFDPQNNQPLQNHPYPNQLTSREADLLAESFVDPWFSSSGDPPYSGLYDLSGAGNPLGGMMTSINDRADGAFWPFFRTESDLARIRWDSRIVGQISSTAVGAVESLQRYIFGKGFTFRTEPADRPVIRIEDADRVATIAQGIVDQFLADNNVINGLDEELDTRIRHDGNAFLALESRASILPETPDYCIATNLRFLEPDQITEPMDKYRLEKWLQIADRKPMSWSFGVLTEKRQPNTPLGYHAVFDGHGGDWEFYPASPCHPNPSLAKKCLVRLKKNSPSTVKMGLPDFFPVVKDLHNKMKLDTAMGVGAAIQASIAWVEQLPQNATYAATKSQQIDTSLGVRFQTVQGGSTQQVPVHQYRPGTKLQMGGGRQFAPGPMGSERNVQFIETAQYLLRQIGVRWNSPEYMISGDASNSSYASTLVAESPFVKARESEQRFYSAGLSEVVWAALGFACQAGAFREWNVRTLAELKRVLKLVVSCPPVASRDPLVLAQVQQIQMGLGILSARTAAEQSDLDYEDQFRNGARPNWPVVMGGEGAGATGGIAGVAGEIGQPAAGAGGVAIGSTDGGDGSELSQPGGALRGLNRRDWKNAQKAITDILNQVVSGVITADRAMLELGNLGISPADAKRYLAATDDGVVDDSEITEPEGIESEAEDTGDAQPAEESQQVPKDSIDGNVVLDIDMQDPWRQYP